MQANKSHDQPFAIGSHRSCSLTSNSYANSRACASGSPLSMGSEFSGDCPPCSTSSFGGEGDMMYMPAVGTCYRNSLALPSKTSAADHVTAGPERQWALQQLLAPACSPQGLPARGIVPYSGLTSCLQGQLSRPKSRFLPEPEFPPASELGLLERANER